MPVDLKNEHSIFSKTNGARMFFFFFFGSLGHVGDCYIKLSSFVMFSNSLKLSCNVEINIQALAEFSTMTGLH